MPLMCHSQFLMRKTVLSLSFERSCIRFAVNLTVKYQMNIYFLIAFSFLFFYPALSSQHWEALFECILWWVFGS